MDDSFNSFFAEVNLDSESSEEYQGERRTWINGMLVKVEKSDGTVERYQDGKLHSLSGPAVTKKDGESEYWLHGKQVTETEHQSHLKALESEKTSEYHLELNDEDRKKVEKALGRKLN
jgi:hypothetical protein